MSKKVAVFGKMGVKFVPIIEKNFADKYDDWQVTSWPCDDDTAARDAILADCEAAVMSADFILTPGNFGALMAAPNLKILLQPWVGTDWLDAGFLPKGLRFCNAGGHAAPMAEYVLGTMLEHAFALGFQEAINGVAANGMPDNPTALVKPIKTFLLVLSFSCISLWVAM